MNYINLEDLITTLVGAIIIGLIGYLYRKFTKTKNSSKIKSPLSKNNTSDGLVAFVPQPQIVSAPTKVNHIHKEDFSILFIDDDTELKMAENIKTEWANTKVITDSTNIKQSEIRNADVIFVDIQGVGKLLGFADEGLGLAKAIKENYTDKKVILYSAAKKHDIYHEAIQICDKVLKKDANLYEFDNLIEKYYEEKIA